MREVHVCCLDATRSCELDGLSANLTVAVDGYWVEDAGAEGGLLLSSGFEDEFGFDFEGVVVDDVEGFR